MVNMAGFEVITLVSELFYSVIGNALLMGLVVVGIIIMALLIFKVPAVGILGVIIPLVVGLVLNTAGTNFIEIPTWIIIVLFMMAGFLFSAVFLFLTR